MPVVVVILILCFMIIQKSKLKSQKINSPGGHFEFLILTFEFNIN